MSAPTTSDQETYVPSADQAEELAQVYDFLAAHEAAGKEIIPARYLLVGAASGDQVELPEEVHRVLRKAVEALANGLAVTVAPRSTTLTTQQAADLLGVTRPTVIKLLDQGQMPFTRIGTHRRLRLSDVLAYRETRRAQQYAALEATAIDLDDEADLDTVLAELRDARRVVAQRRNAASQS
jgi:excisionase family DNA binding protein